VCKLDSAASDSYIRQEDYHILKNLVPYQGQAVTFPDDDKIKPSHQGILLLHKKISQRAKTSTVLPKLKSSSLVSVGKICDDNVHVIFDKNTVYVIPFNKNISTIVNDSKPLLTGNRNRYDNLYDIEREDETIQNNFQTPASHLGLYCVQQRKKLNKNNDCSLKTQ